MAKHEEVVNAIVEYLQSEIPETDKYEITKILASHYPSAATNSVCPECGSKDVDGIYACGDCGSTWGQSIPSDAAVKELVEAMELAKIALYHEPPDGCWATGPITGPDTGDVINDLVLCPGCAAINAIDAALKPFKEVKP